MDVEGPTVTTKRAGDVKRGKGLKEPAEENAVKGGDEEGQVDVEGQGTDK